MRVALVHDWLTGMRGGEKCLEVFCRIWPDAHLYTLIHQRGRLSPAIERMDIRTSFLQHLPGVFENYRYLLPLMPIAVEGFHLAGYDLVVSLSHCVAKSVRVPRDVPHVCYCFTPMRYAWHMRQAYFPGAVEKAAGGGGRADSRKTESTQRNFLAFSSNPSALSLLPASLLLAALRRWDRATSGRVTHFVAISRTVEQRIRQCYGRDSVVIYPPVNVEFYTLAAVPREEFYLCVSALAPYKRLELAIEACNRLGRRLVVIGSGPEAARLQALAGPNVRFAGWQSDESIREHYRRCRALLFPGIEDLGIVPLEAQACGTPVIAYGAGGATETVIPPDGGKPGTGLLFADQSVDALADAIKRLEANERWVSPQRARANAEQYDTGRFAREVEAHIARVLQSGKGDTAKAIIARDAA